MKNILAAPSKLVVLVVKVGMGPVEDPHRICHFVNMRLAICSVLLKSFGGEFEGKDANTRWWL